MPWGLTLSLSPPCWKENLWYSFQQVCQKRTKFVPHTKTFSPSCWKENLWYSFQQVRRKNVCQGCTNLSTNSVNNNLYPNLWFVYRICQENSVKQMCTICQQNLPRILSLKSVHKFCQQDQQICQQLSLISSKVYILSAGICPQKNPWICKQFVTYSGNNLSLESVHKRIHESVNNLSLILETICH